MSAPPTQRARGALRVSAVLIAAVLALRALAACIYPTDGYRETGRHLDFPPAPGNMDAGGDDSSGDDSSNPPDNNPPPVDAGSDKG